MEETSLMLNMLRRSNTLDMPDGMMDDPSQMKMFDLITCESVLIDVYDAARIYRVKFNLTAT